MSTEEKNGITANWPDAKQFKKSIRMEFLVFVSAIILLLMGITGYVITDRYVDTATKHVIEKLLVQVRSFSGTAGKLIISVNGPDELLLNNICAKIKADNPDVYWAGVADKEGKFLAHVDIKEVIRGSRMPEISGQSGGNALQPGEAFAVSNDTIYVSVPVKENEVLVGYFGVASSNTKIAEVRNATIMTVASITLAMILLGIPFTMFMLNRKLKPIRQITDGLRQMEFDNISFDIPLKSKNEFGYLAETLKVMAQRINRAQQEMVEKERITREFEIAREIQSKILPKEYPQSGNYEFYGTYRSALEVGGDYYDFIDFGENRMAWLVADVSGKSLPGMLVMLLTRDIIKSQSYNIKKPAEILTEVNRELLPNIKKGMFVTMFYGLLDKKTGHFEFASAGHNPLIRLNASNGVVETIKTKGYPLGMLPAGPFSKRIESGEIDLSQDDWLVQYTDGINEAKNSADEEYGLERFIEALRSNWTGSTHDLVEKTIAKHSEFVGDAAQFDDITLIAMKWKAKKSDIYNDKPKEVGIADQPS